MPKGRHLKPDFFTDKHVVSVSPLARLLYQGLWCYSHDCGHLDDEPLELKMRILPADNCDVDALLDELVWNKRIERKNGVIYVPNLVKHSRVDKRYETKCDACKHDADTQSEPDLSTPSTKGSRRDHDVTTQGTQRDHDADGDGDGDGDEQQTPSVVGTVVADAPTKTKRGTRLDLDWKPDPSWHRGKGFTDQYAADQLEAFRDYWSAKAGQQATKLDWDATWRNWLRNAKPETAKRPSNTNGFLDDLRAGIYDGPEAIG